MNASKVRRIGAVLGGLTAAVMLLLTLRPAPVAARWQDFFPNALIETLQVTGTATIGNVVQSGYLLSSSWVKASSETVTGSVSVGRDAAACSSCTLHVLGGLAVTGTAQADTFKFRDGTTQTTAPQTFLSSTSASGAASISLSGLSWGSHYFVTFSSVTCASAPQDLYIRLNADSGSVYDSGYIRLSQSNLGYANPTNASAATATQHYNAAASDGLSVLAVLLPYVKSQARYTHIFSMGAGAEASGNYFTGTWVISNYHGTGGLASIQLLCGSGNITGQAVVTTLGI